MNGVISTRPTTCVAPISPAMVAASVGEKPRSSRIGTRWSCAPKATAVLRQNASVTQRNVGSRMAARA